MISKENSKDLQDKLIVEGINSEGYGIMPKLIMQDKRLTIESKAIYAYLVSYAGAGSSAFPGLKRILSDLCISENRFYRHRKLLIDCGYISVNAIRNEKKVIIKNIYTLHSNPVEISEKGVSHNLEDMVSHKMKDRVSHNLEEGILTSFNTNNLKDDDEINKTDPHTEEIKKLNQLIKISDDFKFLAQVLFNSEIQTKDINIILTFIHENKLMINADIIQQQLSWMKLKNKSEIGINNFASYFCNGYADKLKNSELDFVENVSEDLKNAMGEEELPDIPMFDWTAES